jgi:hypothetical protein
MKGDRSREKSGPLLEPASKQLQVGLEKPLQDDDQTDDCKHSPYDSHVSHPLGRFARSIPSAGNLKPT